MWNRVSSRRPIAAYTIPQDERPDSVAAAFNEFERVGAENGELEGRIHDLEQAAKEAPARGDYKAAKKIEADLEAARLELKTSDQGVDAAGNHVADDIGTEQDGWIPKLEARRAQAASEYAEAVALAQAKGEELARLNGQLAWLRNFDTGEARAGLIPQWHGGGRLDVVNDDPGPLRGEHRAADLLALAARAVEPPTVRGTRQHVVAGGSSM